MSRTTGFFLIPRDSEYPIHRDLQPYDLPVFESFDPGFEVGQQGLALLAIGAPIEQQVEIGVGQVIEAERLTFRRFGVGQQAVESDRGAFGS